MYKINNYFENKIEFFLVKFYFKAKMEEKKLPLHNEGPIKALQLLINPSIP